MVVTIPVLGMGSQRHREVLVRRLTASRRQSWMFEPGHVAPDCLLPAMPPAVLKRDCAPESRRELVKPQVAGPYPLEFMIQQVWDEA